MTTTSSQSQAQAMSTPQAAEATQESENPKSTPCQEMHRKYPMSRKPRKHEVSGMSHINRMGVYHYYYPRPIFEVRNWTENSKIVSIQCN